MKYIIVMIVGVLSSTMTSTTTNAYVTNSVTTTTPPSINIMDWLPKNAFLPKTNLVQIQEQLIHTVLNIQLDMATTNAVTMPPPTTAAAVSTTLDPNQEFMGWNTNHQGDREKKKMMMMQKKPKETIKSSHLLLQRSSDPTPRLPIRNLQFMLGTTIETPVMTPQVADVGSTSTSTASTTSRCTTKVKEHHHHHGSMLLPMPGYNGPHPLLSSGLLPLMIQNCGDYVTLHQGVQSLPLTTTTTTTTSSDHHDDPTLATTTTLLSPQWEVIWKEQSPTGTIVCGMELQHSIRRNEEAMIPAGIMYISFPIWDGAQLLEYQKKKVQYDITSKLYSQERDMEIEKMTQSSNIFNKLLHYRNAFAAAENYSLQPHKMYQNVPATLSDLIAITNDDHNNNNDDESIAPFYIVPKGMVRIVPTATMKQLTQSTPCGKQVVMNHMLWSSSTSSNKKDPDGKHGNNNSILHGTAKITIPLQPPRRTLPSEATIRTEVTPFDTSSTNTDTSFM